ncbi:pentapeptide repeat-containing protein [Pseudoduganella umbonata]|nr:pentapeptide repeat-containing protein [Pseudoduganella umbonata]MBB3219821.1 uncharacterized protein YjbI with pentapeptide repeats [Pseudoduganella umbonata]
MNPELLRILEECIRTHRTARGLALAAADLRGARLQGLRADGLDLRDADLRDSLLADARWKACSLQDARLEGANLAGAILRLCILDDVRAAGTRLPGARIENSQARAARFDDADLTDAVLTDTDFSRASFRGAVLENVSATGSDFRGADLRKTRLRGAVLHDADLRGADLTGAEFTDADLAGADLRGAVFDPTCDPICHPARGEATPGSGNSATFPDELRPLVDTMAPVVAQVLRSAGEHAVMDSETAHRLAGEAQRLRGGTPAGPIELDTIAAVSRILPLLGGDLLPELAKALKQPPGTVPPPEVQATILALRRELGLRSDASTEDVLATLLRGLRGGHA